MCNKCHIMGLMAEILILFHVNNKGADLSAHQCFCYSLSGKYNN